MKTFHDLPSFARTCPACDYDLSGSFDGEEARCPECGGIFTRAELIMMHRSNTAGEPRSFSPHESRISGRSFVLIGALLLGLIGLVIAWW